MICRLSRPRAVPPSSTSLVLPQSSGLIPRRHRWHRTTPRPPERRSTIGNAQSQLWMLQRFPAQPCFPKTRPRNTTALRARTTTKSLGISSPEKSANAESYKHSWPDASKRQKTGRFMSGMRTTMKNVKRIFIESEISASLKRQACS